MTLDQFIAAESEADRAFRVLSYYATPEIRAQHKRAAEILAEVRFAAQFLCDPTSEHRQAALERLAQLFDDGSPK